jgi:hypothetical protein
MEDMCYFLVGKIEGLRESAKMVNIGFAADQRA